MIDFYTSATPNGYKVAIMLEESGLPYVVHKLDLAALEQKAVPFVAINPNGRIPAIVDHDNAGFSVFESGAILMGKFPALKAWFESVSNRATVQKALAVPPPPTMPANEEEYAAIIKGTRRTLHRPAHEKIDRSERGRPAATIN